MGGSSTNTTETAVSGIEIQTSLLGQAIGIGWGRGKLSPNLIDYVGFKAIPSTTKAGGKGASSSNTTYTYTATIIMALCEGPIQGIRTVYRDSSVFKDGSTTALAQAGLTMALGGIDQAVWPTLTSLFPDHALAYSSIAYVCAQDYGLGSGAQLSNHSFEIDFAIQFGPNGDADPRDIVTDFLVNTSYGVTGWSAGLLPDWSDWSTYCKANNILLSPVLTSGSQGADFLKKISEITNSEFFWSEGLLKIKPYGDAAVTGNGVTWTPDLTPVYDLTEDDFLDEVQLEIVDQSDAKNYVQVQYLDRTNQYQPAVEPAQDLDDIVTFGLRKRDADQYDYICDSDVARMVAQLRLQRILYIRDYYHFTLPEDFVALEQMDYVTITTTVDGMKLNRQLVLIREIEEQDDGSLQMVAEGVPGHTASAALYPSHTASGFQPEVEADPGDVNAPILFIPPAGLMGLDGELWIAAAGASANWGGCEVWISADGTSYQYVGSIAGPARYGALTASLASHADPDSTNTLAVDLSASLGTLTTATSAEMDAGATLSIIDGELISYQNAVLTSANHYNLSPLRRGLYGTNPAAHAAGAPFVRLDNSIFKLAYKSLNVGDTIYVKMPSFNIYGRGRQGLSGATAYVATLGDLPGVVATSVADGSVTNAALATSSVETGNIAPGAVTGSVRVLPSGSVVGSGAYSTIATMTVILAASAEIDITANAGQHYSGGVKDWGLRLKVDGVVVKEFAYGSGRSGYLEILEIQRAGVSAAAGSRTITLEWAGTDGTISVDNIDLAAVWRYV